jgi:very-short-patch-repair endonuclease
VAAARALVLLASQQHGAVSIEQARAAGLTARAQRAAIAGAWLSLACDGVLVIAGSADTWHRRLQIGLLVLHGEGWVSHESAATLYRFDRCLVGPLHFTVPRARRDRRVPDWMVLHTTAFVGPNDVITLDGFPCTSATRTILDLATLGVPTVRLAAAIDTAVRDRRSAPTVIAARLETLRGSGRAGCRIVERLLPDSGGETLLERRYLRLTRRHGFVRPTTQRVIRHGRKHVARVDFIYEEHRLVVEVTGRKGHVSDAERARDAQRRNELQDLGYRVIEYTSTDLRDRPGYVVDTLRSRLGPSSPTFMSGSSDQIGRHRLT